MSSHAPFAAGRAPARPPTTDAEVRVRKRQTFGLLDLAGQQLDPTATQMERAQSAYEAIGAWLSEDNLLTGASIYVQGSIAHGTATKPISRNEHDVDLICHVPGYSLALSPASLKSIVGERLAAHERYRPILEEMPRCWRLNYAGDFHLDITPSIVNPASQNGGELVPDRLLREWKASHPKGFRDLFARRAALVAVSAGFASDGRALAKADIEPFPVKTSAKGVLRRTVQLLKRHRDIFFLGKDAALAPLSIIITTLASRAYEWCVGHHTYDNELDLVCDTIRAMPWFMESFIEAGSKQWLVLNETTAGENFAEKWNRDRRRAEHFFSWHAVALRDFEAVSQIEGLDRLADELKRLLGNDPVLKAMDAMATELGEARKSNRLLVAPMIGLTTAATAAATPVRANTFYGR